MEPRGHSSFARQRPEQLEHVFSLAYGQIRGLRMARAKYLYVRSVQSGRQDAELESSWVQFVACPPNKQTKGLNDF
jgi:hypothetical protein